LEDKEEAERLLKEAHRIKVTAEKEAASLRRLAMLDREEAAKVDSVTNKWTLTLDPNPNPRP